MGWFGGKSIANGDEPRWSPNFPNERLGKFPDLSEFMTTEGYQPRDVPGTQAYIDAGHIIYIKDPSAGETRINDRVMLVLSHNHPFSYTGLSFCYHSEFSGETLQSSHALVYTDQNEQPTPQAAQTQQPNIHLEIHLRHNNTPFSLKPNIYLNLREHWNIEQEVRFVILGRADTDSYKRLVPHIKRVFDESISGADILKESGDPSDIKQQSTTPERKINPPKEKGQVARSTKKDKRRSRYR